MCQQYNGEDHLQNAPGVSGKRGKCRSVDARRSWVAEFGHSLSVAWQVYRQCGISMLLHKAYLKSFRLRRALSPVKYLRRTAPSDRELARQRRIGAELAKKIHFAIVPADTAEGEARRLLRQALERQTFPGWTLLEAEPSETCNCTHLLFPDAGTIPYPQALFELAEFFERHPETELLYTDDAWYETEPDKPFFINGKPDFSEIALCGGNYIGTSWCVTRELASTAGIGDGTFSSLFKLTEAAGNVAHLSKVLFACRGRRADGDPLVARRIDAPVEGRAIEDHLRRIGRSGHAERIKDTPFFRIRQIPEGKPLVSILIPNRDQSAVLRRCVNSIFERSTWRDFEIVVLENGSCEPATERLYGELSGRHGVRVVRCPAETPFNYSRINNFGVTQCRGEYIVFMNNDIEVITPSWIEEMLIFAQRSEVGAVGAKLCFPDDTIQHGGVLVGFSGAADHLFLGAGRTAPGYAGWLSYARDCSAVTFACSMVRRAVWEQTGGLDESFALSFNDVDFCLNLRKSGYRVVWTPFAEFYHHESLSRGYDVSDSQYQRLRQEIGRFQRKWSGFLAAGDPFYNANLSLIATDCRLRHPPERRLIGAVFGSDAEPCG